MAVTTSSSATIRGIKYSKGSSFKCYASYEGAAGSEGEGSASALTKGTTYYFYGAASGSGVKYPYAVCTSSSAGASTIRGWYKENVFPYATYSVTYNANGGSGAPGNQTKTYGSTLTLSTTKPTRTGYTFQGWGTSAGDTSVDYAAGASYTKNAAITLYAIWKAETYTISFDAKGGADAPSSVTKTYGETLKLPTTVPTRANYEFKGWATSETAAIKTYDAGDSYTGNENATLYAVWELKYERPKIENLNVARCSKIDDSYVLDDFGTYVRITFDYSCNQLLGENKVSSITLVCDGITKTLNPAKTDGSVTWHLGGSLSVDEAYTVTVTVVDTLKSDGSGETKKTITLSAAVFPIDFLAGGKGVAICKPAEQAGLDVATNVYINAIDTVRMSVADNEVFEARNDYGNMVLNQSGYANSNSKTYVRGSEVHLESKGGISLTAPSGITTGSTLHLTKTQDASAAADNDVALIIGDRSGNHMVLDTNEIIAKSSGTAEAKIWIGEKLGNVAIGGVTYGQNNVLATTGSYLTADQTITLSQAISAQAHGVILIWCYYSSGVKNYGWNYVFIPKYAVTMWNTYSSGSNVFLTNGTDTPGAKYIYIKDTSISGHADNTGTHTAGGITFYNSNWVLKYVIGV